MRAVLITLTVVEIVIFLGAVVAYLVMIARSLRAIAEYLGKVSFGVRAIESQSAPIGPSVLRINEQLNGIARVLDGTATMAEVRTQ